MAKQVANIRMEPWTQRDLRALAAQWGKPLGDTVEGLLKFIKYGQAYGDPEFVAKFNMLLEAAMVNTGRRYGWAGDEVAGDE